MVSHSIFSYHFIHYLFIYLVVWQDEIVQSVYESVQLKGEEEDYNIFKSMSMKSSSTITENN